MKNKKLFIIDLDGTTLINQNELHPDLIRDVKKVMSKGHIVAIATGRSFNSSIKFYNQLELQTYLINCNGNFINNPLNKKDPLIVHHFSSSIVNELIHDPEIKGAITDIIMENDSYLKASKNVNEKLEQWYVSSPVLRINLEDKIEKEEILSAMIFVKRKNQEKVFKKILAFQEVSVYVIDNWSNEGVIMEIFSKKGTKGRAVSIIQLKYQVASENIYVFGDSFNDISMFSLLGVQSHAVANAVDELKNNATKVLTKTNKENAVGEEMLRIIGK